MKSIIYIFTFSVFLVSCATTKKFQFSNNKIYQNVNLFKISNENQIEQNKIYYSRMSKTSSVIKDEDKSRNAQGYTFTAGQSGEYIFGLTSYNDKATPRGRLFVGEPIFINSKQESVPVYGKNAKIEVDLENGWYYRMSYVVKLKQGEKYKVIIQSDPELEGAELFRKKFQDDKVIINVIHYGSKVGNYTFRVRKADYRDNNFISADSNVEFVKKTHWIYAEKNTVQNLAEASKSHLGGGLLDYVVNSYLFGFAVNNPNLNYKKNLSLPLSASIYRDKVKNIKGENQKTRLLNFHKKLNIHTENLYQGFYKPSLIKDPERKMFNNRNAVVASFESNNPLNREKKIESRTWYIENRGIGYLVIISYTQGETEVDFFQSYIQDHLIFRK